MLGLIIIPSVVGYVTSKNTVRSIAVVDETGILAPRLAGLDDSRLEFISVEAPVESLRTAVQEGKYEGYLILPLSILEGEAAASYYSIEGGGLTLESNLENVLDNTIDEWRLAELNASPEVLEIIRTGTAVRLLQITEEGEAADATAASSVIGMIMGFVIYGAMVIYGAYVMHGVMEEKQTRVLEVVVSSVRPFELLMGKVLGIGAMGLVQMAAWAVLLIGLSMSAGGIASLFLNPADFNLPEGAGQEELLAAANFTVPQISPSVFVWFLLFFLGGYLLYSSIFAAVGAAVEHQQDAQGLMLPVTLLIVIPILFISVLIESPNSSLSVVLSLIPFFSPILMVVRVAVTSVPLWQVALSFLLLCLTFIGSIWVSGRIYRVGILMYGKKPTFRDLARWFRYG
jgi:ABC-2 type transport system permease protein